MSKKLTIQYFTAVWCGPCKRFSPILEETVKEYDTQVQLNKIDIDENQELAAEHSIRSVPTIVIMDENNNSVTRHSGFISKENLKTIINNLLM